MHAHGTFKNEVQMFQLVVALREVYFHFSVEADLMTLHCYQMNNSTDAAMRWWSENAVCFSACKKQLVSCSYRVPGRRWTSDRRKGGDLDRDSRDGMEARDSAGKRWSCFSFSRIIFSFFFPRGAQIWRHRFGTGTRTMRLFPRERSCDFISQRHVQRWSLFTDWSSNVFTSAC